MIDSLVQGFGEILNCVLINLEILSVSSIFGKRKRMKGSNTILNFLWRIFCKESEFLQSEFESVLYFMIKSKSPRGSQSFKHGICRLVMIS